MTKEQSVFETLNAINVKDKVEKKNNMDYLSWAYAWSTLKHAYPDAQRVVYESPFTGMNYFTDGNTAYVKVGIIVGGIEHIDYLPVMDYKNKSIHVDNLTSFDVNKTIQRSTVKAIAMHGLGIQLWTGEDLPDNVQTHAVAPSKPAMEKKKEADKIDLSIGDENWENVVSYVVGNKPLGIDAILNKIEKKYKLKVAVKNELINKFKA